MEITPDKWQRAKALFDAVLQRPASERHSFLAATCPENDLRQQVEQLLRNHEQAGSFLSKPVIELPKSDLFSPGSIIAGRFKIVCLLVIQRILRHSNVAVTQACYIKTASEDAKAAMQKLETALNDTYVTPRRPVPGTKGIM
jgi:hypothetical protein